MSEYRHLALLAFVSAFLLFFPLCLGEREVEEPGRIRGENGEISLAIAVPLTSNGEEFPDPGWAHMAAAQLAIDHFNEKNPVVVPQLAQFVDCPIRISNVSVIDTATNSHKAMKTLLQRIQEIGVVDAIAGPYNEQPALELSVLATGMESPMVAVRGLNHNLVLPDKHPFFSQINPDLYGEMEFVTEFLRHTNRTNFIAILYSNEDSVLQRVEVLQDALKERLGSDQVRAFNYQSVAKTQEGEDRGIREAVSMVSQTGFRTIIMLSTNYDIDSPPIGAAALEFQLDQGGHFWIIPGDLDPTGTDKDKILLDHKSKPEGGFLRGAAFTYLFEGHNIDPEDPFEKSLLALNASFVQRLRDINPVANYKGEIFCDPNDAATRNSTLVDQKCEPTDDVFQMIPYFGDRVGFMYDATMSIGIGACMALANKTNTTMMTGKEHLEGIQSVDFRGATGKVRFRNQPGTPGSRDARSLYYGILNLLPHGAEGEPTQVAYFVHPETREWIEVFPFVFSDGTNSPPLLLRKIPQQNYLDPVVRGFGLALMSIALLFIFVSAVWVWMNRKHRIVVAAQPPYMFFLCLGSTLISLVILVTSFDESYGWSDEMLDAACVAGPWLYVLGDMVVYSALFTKLWRVNNVLQFKRTRIRVRQFAWPALFLIVSAVVLLAVWTAVGDFGWVREEVDPITGETIGRCSGSLALAFLLPIGIICSIPTLLTCIMAWKTKDVGSSLDALVESRWIFALVLVQMQVIVVGIPVVLILQTVSTNGRYIGLALIVSTFPISTMGLIMIPKMLAVRKEKMNGIKADARKNDNGASAAPCERESQSRLSVPPSTDPSEQMAGSTTASPMDLRSSRIQMVTIE